MKFSPWTVLTFGLSVSLVILSVGWFQFWAPREKERGFYLDYLEKLKIEARKIDGERRKREQAIELVQSAGQEWQSIVVRKTPPASLEEGGIDLAVNRWQLVVDAPRFRNSIQRDLNRQLRTGGVTVISGPVVPAFPDNPLTIVEEGFNYPQLGFPARVYDFGSVVVEGTMEQIRRHVESWSNMPEYIAVADGLRIEGTPPRLRATYNLSMVMYLRSKNIFPPVPEGAAGAAGAAPGAPGAAIAPGVGGPGGPGRISEDR